jgi:hypothetical protein
MSPPAKVLVVANRTADSDELRAALLERSARGPIEVTLLAPAAWEVADPHGVASDRRPRNVSEQWSVNPWGSPPKFHADPGSLRYEPERGQLQARGLKRRVADGLAA